MHQLTVIAVNFIAGSAMIIIGVRLLGRALENANLALLDKAMRFFSSNKWTAFFAGIGLTALVQSSTAITILTVGFVDSGLMRLESAVGVIYGANIGTTLTAQLMSFNVSRFAFYILAAGVALVLLPHRKLRTVGKIVIGLGLLFSGLNLMNRSVIVIKENPFFISLLENNSDNILLCAAIGLIITALVQSSSVTVGMTLLLFNHGLLPFASAAALTLGDNLGSCVTTLISSLQSGTAGRRTAWAHMLYNLAGVLLALALLPQFCHAVLFVTGLLGQDTTRLVANSHTFFNVLSAVLFLPFSKYYVKFLEFLIPDRKEAGCLKQNT